jgi:uncharacterized membrane-anchored protein
MKKVVSLLAKPLRAIGRMLPKIVRPLRLLGKPLVKLSRLRGRALVVACIAIVVVLFVLVSALRPEPDREDEVRETLERFAAATRDKDYQTLCDDLYAEDLVERSRAAGLPCEVALRTGLEDRQNPQLRVLSVEVDGDRATARVRSTAVGEVPSTDTVGLERDGDDWKVSSLSDAGAEPVAP